ncbi:hypothetical protein ABPG72_013887 [Tetrahymena utriculariae]
MTTEENQDLENIVTKQWLSYSEEEYFATYIALPRFIKVFRGKFQQIFNRRTYAIFNFSMSIGEIIVFVGALAGLGVNMGFSYGNKNNSGSAAGINLLVCIVFTVKNSILTFLCGLSYERGIFWHKVFGWLAVLGGVLHLLSTNNQWDGWFMLGSLFGMLGVSLWPIRYFLYEIFIRLHWVGFIVVIVGVILHGVDIAIYGLGYWGLDFLIKQAVIFRHLKNAHQVQIEKVTSDMAKITILDNKINYQGGQYLCICIPKLSYFQWHPFSIQSSFGEKKIEIFVKKSGNWTRDLLVLAEKLNGEQTKAYLCGPYGFPSIDIASDYYKTFILIGGGIGITPIISVCKQLLEERIKGRPITKIYLIWTTRSKEKHEELLSEQYIESILSLEDKQKNLVERFYHLSTINNNKKEQNNVNDTSENQTEVKLNTECGKFILQRPDIKEYLKIAQETAKKNDESRVGVMVCGPSALIRSVQEKSSSVSNCKIRLDVHEEVFAL